MIFSQKFRFRNWSHFGLTAISSAMLIAAAATAALAEAYKTNRNQVVVTGLQAQTAYTVETTNNKGRHGNRRVVTNACGEALISNGAVYQQLVVAGQAIVPANLPTKVHQRCTSGRR